MLFQTARLQPGQGLKLSLTYCDGPARPGTLITSKVMVNAHILDRSVAAPLIGTDVRWMHIDGSREIGIK